jgi:hypothetical protein
LLGLAASHSGTLRYELRRAALFTIRTLT